MSSPEHGENDDFEDIYEDQAEGLPYIQYYAGNAAMILHRENTFLKTFSFGNGMNDYCLHTFDGEHVVAFKAEPDVYEKLLEIGVSTREYDELDERDIDFLASSFSDQIPPSIGSK